MNRAMIRVRPCGAEGLGKGFTMLQIVGVETSVVRGHRVGRAVLIGPLHLRSHSDCYGWRSKCEIADIYRACLRFRCGRTIGYLNAAEQPVVFDIAWARY